MTGAIILQLLQLLNWQEWKVNGHSSRLWYHHIMEEGNMTSVCQCTCLNNLLRLVVEPKITNFTPQQLLSYPPNLVWKHSQHIFFSTEWCCTFKWTLLQTYGNSCCTKLLTGFFSVMGTFNLNVAICFWSHCHISLAKCCSRYLGCW